MSSKTASPAPASPPRPSRPRPADEGPLHSSVSFGRVAGVEIGAHWSWLVVFALIVWSLGAAVFPDEHPGLSDGVYAAMAFAAATLFFVSLILHELGHATVARREGMEIEGITLWVFGGVARFRGMFPSAGTEFRVAIAGPVVSLLLGVCLLLAAGVVPLPEAVTGVLRWLGRINLILLAFNMLPALPLDGGRVLRSVLWQRSRDFARSTQVAGALGRGFGTALIAFGLVGMLVLGAPGGLWFALIGWFLTVAATAEVGLVETRQALQGLTVADAMVADPVSAPAEMPLSLFMGEVFARRRHSAYPVTSDGRLVGLLTFRQVAGVAPERWVEVRVADAMIPLADAAAVEAGEPLGDVALELAQNPVGRVPVTVDGVLAGLLSITDVSRLLELQRLRGHA